MKKILNLSILLMMLLASLSLASCSDDDDPIDINSGEAYLTINEIPVYSSLNMDFLGDNYVGCNFADTDYGYLYASGGYASGDDNPIEISASIEFYFSNLDFQTMRKGEQMTFYDRGDGIAQSKVSTTRGTYIQHYYREYKGGEILFESFDSETNLLWLRLNNVVFGDEDGEEMRLNGLAMFEYR